MKRLSTKRSDELSEHAVTLVPEDPEDMWHAYNLILPGDILKGHAIRNIREADGSGSLRDKVERVHTILAISVEAIFWDPTDSQLHAKGRVVSENKQVSMGKYHTLDLEINRSFVLDKPDGWDSVSSQMLREALDDDKAGAIAAIVMQEGIANICLVTQYRTILKQRIEYVIPGKRSSSKELDSATQSFFSLVLAGLRRHVSFDEPRPLLLASPGFVAADFQQYMLTKGTTGEFRDKKLQEVANHSTVVHSPTGHVHSLNEILKSPEVTSVMDEMKFSQETKHIQHFYDLLRREDGRAWYGASIVTKAVVEGAVGRGGMLLVNNSLFRSQELATRKEYVALVDRVRAGGGEAIILSSDLESGKRLHMLGDIAAVLSYPIPDLGEDNYGLEERDEAEIERPLEGSII